MKSVGPTAKTAVLVVPENRRRARSRALRLRVRMLGRVGAPVIFHLTGGPGMSNLVQRYPKPLLEAFRVVEVGYRGLDSTPSLDGRLLARALGRRDLSSTESKAALEQAFAASVALWREQGFDLAGYQLRDIASDLEDARRALGLDRVHLLAQSYGTRVALHYMTQHPDAIASSVLIGANPPGHFFWSSADVHDAFAAYQPHFEAACPEYTGKLELEELCARVLERLPERWLGLRIDRDRVRMLTFFLLFHRTTAVWVFDTYLRAQEKGAFGRFALASLAMGVSFPRMGAWGDFFIKGLLADYDPERDYASEALAAPGRFGSPLGQLLFAPAWDRSVFADRDPPAALDVRPPTLVLSGALDFSTPAKNARELTTRFPCVVQLVEPDKGHVADFWREPALPGVLERFFGAGEAPEPGTFRRHPIRFRR